MDFSLLSGNYYNFGLLLAGICSTRSTWHYLTYLFPLIVKFFNILKFKKLNCSFYMLVFPVIALGYAKSCQQTMKETGTLASSQMI